MTRYQKLKESHMRCLMREVFLTQQESDFKVTTIIPTATSHYLFYSTNKNTFSLTAFGTWDQIVDISREKNNV